ncbi:unnamed protein product [Ectocarpus sp. 6 AP-2014]
MAAQPEVSMSTAQLIERFTDLESVWKTPGTPEGISNLLEIFNITCAEDMTPQTVVDKYNEDWKAYCCVRRDLDILANVYEDPEQDEADMGQVDEDMELRFSRFQDNIWYGKETMLSFFRMTNSQQSFPPCQSAEYLFWMQPMNKGALKPSQALILFILGSMHRAKYKRHGQRVYEQIFIDGHATRAWKDKCSILNQIQTFSAKETSFEMWQTTTERMDATVKYLTECQDVEFPDINRNRRAWSFNDGIYNASDDTFCLYAHESDDDLVTSKLIRMPFAGVYFEGQPLPSSPRLRYDNIPTPLFESIFTPQNWDADMVRWMFVFIGRLFYHVNEADSWQVIPFLKGVAGTGKSTVIKIIQAIYSPAEIGVLSNNVEKKFGLSALVDKTLFIVPEVKSDCQLDQAEFQSIVTGEELSLAVKHESPWCGRWTVPGIMAGRSNNTVTKYVPAQYMQSLSRPACCRTQALKTLNILELSYHRQRGDIIRGQQRKHLEANRGLGFPEPSARRGHRPNSAGPGACFGASRYHQEVCYCLPQSRGRLR